MAVFFVHASRLAFLFAKDLHIPENFAIIGIYGQCVESVVVLAIRNSGGEVDFGADNDRGRPPNTWDVAFPCDVFAGAPIYRNVFRI